MRPLNLRINDITLYLDHDGEIELSRRGSGVEGKGSGNIANLRQIWDIVLVYCRTHDIKVSIPS